MILKNVIMRNSWRDSASLIVLSKRGGESQGRDACNYDVLLQTRPQRASFRNSVVFPGGATEAADASPAWLQLLRSFGYTQGDFDTLHRKGTPVTAVFQDDPIQRHVALRITAIRETFEELGLLICSSVHRGDKKDVWASNIADIDVKHWQNRVSKDPAALLNLCEEVNCYPDIWSLHYWSNWLSPTWQPKRFDAAFFVTAFQNRPLGVRETSEVVKVEWSSPLEILERTRDPKVLVYPPQVYELIRLAHWSDVEKLAKFAQQQSCVGYPLYYHASVQAVDGKLFVYPGDDLYPPSVDFNNHTIIKSEKTLSELRESSKSVHRFEFHTKDSKTYLVLKNFKPREVDMGDQTIEVHPTTK